MKFPKQVNRYCPYCKEHTPQIVATAKQKSRSATHPMSRGSTPRLQARGLRVGYGNQGRYSRQAPKNWKRKTKVTKRIALMYKCSKCGKMKGIRSAIRSSRIEIGEKISK